MSAAQWERDLRFGVDDVAAFARASGDVNPIHVDPAFARRSPFGDCIVHGCLLALRMLGVLPDAVLRGASTLTVSFAAPLPVGGSAHATATVVGDTADVRLTSRGTLLARLRVAKAARAETSPPPPCTPQPQRRLPAADPLERGEVRAVDYVPVPALRSLAEDATVGALPRPLLAGLAWASYLAGMEAPGLHGLLAGVTVTTLRRAELEAATLVVRDTDERTGRLVVDSILPLGNSAAAVTVESFARSAPRVPDVEALLPEEAAPALRGAAAVVGASRGLGAALSLALLLRGYDVHGVYATSSDAADELERLGGDAAARLFLHQADAADAAALGAVAATIRSRALPLRALVLAAALPPLPMGLKEDSANAVADFVAASVRMAAAPLAVLSPLLTDDAAVVICSSAALESPPRDWPHYVAAKSALEGLASWLATTRPQAPTVVLRLPKLSTDMTNTPAGRIGAVPVEPIARRLADALVAAELAPGLVVLRPSHDAKRPLEEAHA